MKTRKATIDDVDNNLLNIFIDGFKFHLNGRPDIFNNKTNDELRKELINNITNDKSVIVTLENEKILGFAIFKIKEKKYKTLWVEQLVVDKEFRGKGIAKTLMSKIYEIAEQEKCNKIELCCWSFNDNANNMYKHLGFNEQRVILEKEVE